MAGSTAIWRIILLHTTMLSLHISVVNFNVQPSINKYQVVLTLLSARKKFIILHQQEWQQEASTHEFSFDPSVLCSPISTCNSTPALDNDAKTATAAKALDFHANYQPCAPSTAQHIVVYIYYAQAHKSLILHSDLQVKPEAGPGWNSC